MSTMNPNLNGKWDASMRDANHMLHIYIHDFLCKRNLQRTAAVFLNEASVNPAHVAPENIPINAPQGFLYEWWAVFWDIFVAQNKINFAESATGSQPAQQQSQPPQQSQQTQQPLHSQPSMNERMQTIARTGAEASGLRMAPGGFMGANRPTGDDGNPALHMQQPQMRAMTPKGLAMVEKGQAIAARSANGSGRKSTGHDSEPPSPSQIPSSPMPEDPQQMKAFNEQRLQQTGAVQSSGQAPPMAQGNHQITPNINSAVFDNANMSPASPSVMPPSRYTPGGPMQVPQPVPGGPRGPQMAVPGQAQNQRLMMQQHHAQQQQPQHFGNSMSGQQPGWYPQGPVHVMNSSGVNQNMQPSSPGQPPEGSVPIGNRPYYVQEMMMKRNADANKPKVKTPTSAGGPPMPSQAAPSQADNFISPNQPMNMQSPAMQKQMSGPGPGLAGSMQGVPHPQNPQMMKNWGGQMPPSSSMQMQAMPQQYREQMAMNQRQHQQQQMMMGMGAPHDQAMQRQHAQQYMMQQGKPQQIPANIINRMMSSQMMRGPGKDPMQAGTSISQDVMGQQHPMSPADVPNSPQIPAGPSGNAGLQGFEQLPNAVKQMTPQQQIMYLSQFVKKQGPHHQQGPPGQGPMGMPGQDMMGSGPGGVGEDEMLQQQKHMPNMDDPTRQRLAQALKHMNPSGRKRKSPNGPGQQDSMPSPQMGQMGSPFEGNAHMQQMQQQQMSQQQMTSGQQMQQLQQQQLQQQQLHHQQQQLLEAQREQHMQAQLHQVQQQQAAQQQSQQQVSTPQQQAQPSTPQQSAPVGPPSGGHQTSQQMQKLQAAQQSAAGGGPKTPPGSGGPQSGDAAQAFPGQRASHAPLQPAEKDTTAEDAFFTMDGVDDFFSAGDYVPNDEVVAAHEEPGTPNIAFKEIATLNGHTNKVTCCSFSNDGALLASAGHDRKALTWSMDTCQISHSLEGHNGIITDVRFSHHQNVLASSSFDKTIRIWSCEQDSSGAVGDGRCITTLLGHTSSVLSADFHPMQLELLCSSDSDGEIKLWNWGDSTCSRSLQGGKKTVRFQPLHGSLLAAASDSVVNVFDVGTQEKLVTLSGHSKHVNSLCWHDNGDLLVSASEDSVRVWQVNSGRCIQAFSSPGNKLQCCTFHPSYPSLVVIGGYQAIDLWHYDLNRSVTVTAHDGIVAGLAHCTVSGFIASASHDQRVKLWNRG